MATYTIGPVACTATDPGTGLHEFSGRVILTTTTDTANNATIINTWRFEIYITRDAYVSHYSYQNNNRVSVVINGSTIINTANIGAVAMNGRFASNPLVLCSGGPITVPHNADGTKSMAVSANYTQTGSGNYIGTIAPSGTITLETIARADKISSAPDVTLTTSGVTQRVSWTNSSNFYHSIEYKYGDETLGNLISVERNADTYKDCTIQASWATKVTNAKKMTLTVILHSYSNSGRTNELGTSSKTFVVTFDDSFAPTFGTPTLVQNDRLSSTIVAGRSYTSVTVTPSYKNSASFVSGYAVYMDGDTELGGRKAGNPASGITLGTIPAFTATSKSIKIKYSVTDSRGFTTTGTSSAFTVYGWIAPSITSLTAVRCTSNGTEDLSGNYFKVTVSYSIRPLNNANAKTILVRYRWNSESTFNDAVQATPSNYSGTLTLGPYGLQSAQDDKLIVRVEVYDSLSSSNHTTADTTVLPVSVFMDIMTSGDKKVGLAVGMVNGKMNTVQLGWPLELVDDGRAVLDPDVGLTFYNQNNIAIGNYPPDGSVIDVDDSLSEPGAAADAKATGDAIAELTAKVGAPMIASTSSAMTDRTRVYVYTGNQSGYVFGNWYYWNGSSWTSGGVYNSLALETDKTLTLPDEAADAKATGMQINDLRQSLGEGFLSQISGNKIVIENGDGQPFREVKVEIAYRQNGRGTPSPSNVRSFTGYTGTAVNVSPNDRSSTATRYSVSWSGSAGTVYHGMLNITTGELTVDWYRMYFDGSSDEPWTSVTTPNIFRHNAISPAPSFGSVTELVSNETFVTAYNYTTMKANYPSISIDTSDRVYLAIGDDYTTTAQCKSWLASHPLEILYRLETPLTYSLTPQQVTALVGMNYIWADTGYISIDYKQDMYSYVKGQEYKDLSFAPEQIQMMRRQNLCGDANHYLQGGCYVSSTGHFVFAFAPIDGTGTNTTVLVETETDFSTVIQRVSNINYGHANDLTYNPTTNKIYISSTGHKSGSSYVGKVTVVNPSTLAIESGFVPATGNLVSAVSYDPDNNVYYTSEEEGGNRKVYKYDGNWNLLDTMGDAYIIDPERQVGQGSEVFRGEFILVTNSNYVLHKMWFNTFGANSKVWEIISNAYYEPQTLLRYDDTLYLLAMKGNEYLYVYRLGTDRTIYDNNNEFYFRGTVLYRTENLNNIKDTGKYYETASSAPTVTNTPVTLSVEFSVDVTYVGYESIKQTLTAADGRMWYRCYNNSTSSWSSWKSL